MTILKLKDYNNIYYIDGFWEEYDSLFGKSKAELKDYKKKLLSNLAFLDNLSTIEEAITIKNFEKLTTNKTPYLYCIRHKSKLNPRTIFVYEVLDESGDKAVILLNSFFEKSTNQDYNKAIEKAYSIVKRIEESD